MIKRKSLRPLGLYANTCKVEANLTSTIMRLLILIGIFFLLSGYCLHHFL